MEEKIANFIGSVAKASQRIFTGRINRLQFLTSFFLVSTLPVVCLILFVIGTELLLRGDLTAKIIEFVPLLGVICALSILQQALVVRRIHDMGVPGWFILVPVVNGILVLAALVWPGQKETNAFGHKPTENRSIQDVIFNTKATSHDKGETWLGTLFLVILDVLLVVWIGMWINALHTGSVNNVQYVLEDGRTVHVSPTTLQVLCGDKNTRIEHVDDPTDLRPYMGQIVKGCGVNFSAQLFHGSDGVYNLWARTNADFSSTTTHLVTLEQKAWTKTNLNDLEVALYTAPHFERVYAFRITSAPDFTQKTDPISFMDTNADRVTDVRVYAPVAFGEGYQDIFIQSDGSLVLWNQINKDSHYSYSKRGDTWSEDALYGNIGIPYYDGKPLQGADPNTFKILSYKYAKDKNHVYSYGSVDDFFNAETFEALSYSEEYVKDKNGVYFDGHTTYTGLTGHAKIEGADPRTFVYLGGNYSKDKNTVFYLIDPFGGVDSATFELIPNSYSTETGYMKDKDHVYYHGNPLPYANQNSFQALNSVIGTDGLNVFFAGDVVGGSDPSTFKILHWQYPMYARDSNQAYYYDGAKDPVIKGADPDTFTFFETKYGASDYSKDKTNVFWENKIIPDADVKTFELIMGSTWDYAKDKDHVFREGQIVSASDPVTFSPPR